MKDVRGLGEFDLFVGNVIYMVEGNFLRVVNKIEK